MNASVMTGTISMSLVESLIQTERAVRNGDSITARLEFGRLVFADYIASAGQDELDRIIKENINWRNVCELRHKPQLIRTKRIYRPRKSSVDENGGTYTKWTTEKRAHLNELINKLANGQWLTEEQVKEIGVNTRVRRITDKLVLVPWLIIENREDLYRFTIDTKLRDLCEGLAIVPEIGISTVQFLRDTLSKINSKRIEIGDKRSRPWLTDDKVKVEQSLLFNEIVESMESFLSKLPM